MESKNIIQNKWENGVYQLKDMVKLVREGIITKEDFFDITRFSFDDIIETRHL